MEGGGGGGGSCGFFKFIVSTGPILHVIGRMTKFDQVFCKILVITLREHLNVNQHTSHTHYQIYNGHYRMHFQALNYST